MHFYHARASVPGFDHVKIAIIDCEGAIAGISLSEDTDRMDVEILIAPCRNYAVDFYPALSRVSRFYEVQICIFEAKRAVPSLSRDDRCDLFSVFSSIAVA